MKQCRECRHEISEQAITCPQCGHPTLQKRHGTDGAWNTNQKRPFSVYPFYMFLSNIVQTERLLLLIISIGKFGCGIINISQFGVGIISISQFTVGVFVIGQFAAAYSLIAQFGLYIHEGYGQMVKNLFEILQ